MNKDQLTVIEEEEGNFQHFTRFYIDIIKMLNECEKRLNQLKQRKNIFINYIK